MCIYIYISTHVMYGFSARALHTKDHYVVGSLLLYPIFELLYCQEAEEAPSRASESELLA